MPVRKYRSVEDMDPPASYQPGDPAQVHAIGGTWALARQANPRRFPPGVERFRSIDEMHSVQETRDGEYVRQLRASRTKDV